MLTVSKIVNVLKKNKRKAAVDTAAFFCKK